jgi:hypothetical protein
VFSAPQQAESSRVQRCSFASGGRVMVNSCFVFKIISSITWKNEISTGTVIHFLQDCSILRETGTADYEDKKKDKI